MKTVTDRDDVGDNNPRQRFDSLIPDRRPSHWRLPVGW